MLCLRLLRFHSPGLGGLGSSIDHDMGASLFGDSDVPFVVAVDIELDVANVSGASRGESSAELKDSVAYLKMWMFRLLEFVTWPRHETELTSTWLSKPMDCVYRVVATLRSSSILSTSWTSIPTLVSMYSSAETCVATGTM